MRTLVENHGNVRVLKVCATDLRRLVVRSPVLRDAVFETIEQGVDASVAVVLQGLRHPDLGKRIEAAADILRHSEAARRVAGRVAGRQATHGRAG